jgi:DNA polymerase V
MLLIAEPASHVTIPFFLDRLPAGFPSPAADYIEGRLDLNEHLIARPAATFIVQISGESLMEAGVYDGDLAIVDRSVQPERGDLVVAAIDGSLTAKFLHWDGRRKNPSNVRLVGANPDFPPLPIANLDTLEIWGVVTATIRQRRR